MRFLLLAAVAALLAAAAPLPPRPPVTGIASVAFLTTQPQAAARFWTAVIGAHAAPDPEDARGQRFFVGPNQFVELLPAPAHPPADLLAHVSYRTTDVAAMRRYLLAVGQRTVSPVHRDTDGTRWIELRDPAGVAVRFVAGAPAGPAAPATIAHRIIHAGHVVRDRAAADSFYRRLLGFRPYWFGGMTDGQVDWVSQQVPDGQDWFEYMLVPATGAPNRAALGGMNHLSLGVGDVRIVAQRLAAEHRPVPGDPKPLLGRDGKWQLNLLDPDGTRVELMNYRASAAPCCSPFTAADPTP